MTKDELAQIFAQEKTNEISWSGECHDCGDEVIVTAIVAEEEKLTVSGGAVYGNEEGVHHMKCEACFEKDPTLRNFRECEVYARVVGYLRPISQWNPGKQAEFKNRKNFNVGGEP